MISLFFCSALSHQHVLCLLTALQHNRQAPCVSSPSPIKTQSDARKIQKSKKKKIFKLWGRVQLHLQRAQTEFSKSTRVCWKKNCHAVLFSAQRNAIHCYILHPTELCDISIKIAIKKKKKCDAPRSVHLHRCHPTAGVNRPLTMRSINLHLLYLHRESGLILVKSSLPLRLLFINQD